MTDDADALDIEIDAAPRDDVEATIIVPTHRGAGRLPLLLDALAAQETDAVWEVLFAIDGVLDETPAVLRTWSDHLPLRTVTTAEPQGVVAAMNAATDAARGRVVIRCDDDLSPGPDFVSRHLAHHPPGSRRGVVGPTRDVWAAGNTYADVYGRVASERHLGSLAQRDPELSWMAWAANNSALREDLLAVGGFDPRFVYSQDSELGYRLMRSGVEIVIDPALTVDHRGPAQTLAARVPRAFIAGASRRLFLLVHPEWTYPEPVRRSLRGSRGLRHRIWPAVAVGIARSARTLRSYQRLGAVGGWLIERVPASTGRRISALLIEAAGVSGQRHGSVRLADYKGQKAAELRAERSSPVRRRTNSSH